MTYDFKKLDEKIKSARTYFEGEIFSLKAGRANPALVENIQIQAYGQIQALKNISSIKIEDAKTLIIQPWDKALLEAISKGIETSNLGIMPDVQKDFVRVKLPMLTQERKETLLKILRKKLEEARMSLRKARDDIWKEIQEKERAKEISEDEKFRLKNQMEEKNKKGTVELEQIAARKEKEIIE